MVDELTGLEVPPEIAAATLNAESEARMQARLDELPSLPPSLPPPTYATSSLYVKPQEHCETPTPPALIPFEEFERRIRVLRENGVRAYQDNVIKVQIDTFKRQSDPVPLAHETTST